MILLAIATMSGCGTSTVAPASTDPPDSEFAMQSSGPSSASVAKSDKANIDASMAAPGVMGLPPDADLNQTIPASPPRRGFEMPSDDDPRTNFAAPAETSIQYASWDAIKQQATSSGKITVVDLWSLSCEPCLKEFPELVKLHRAAGDKVQCIAVNVDFDGRKSRPPQYYADQVSMFLASNDATGFPAYICETASDDVYAAADIDSIPTVMVFDTDGKPVKVFVDAGETLGFTYQKDILPLLDKIMN